MQTHDHRSDEREHDSHQAEHSAPPPARTGTPRSRSRWVFFGFLAISAFFLIAEHRAHLLGYLPWLILLACPLMHIFMHRGHGHGHGHGGHGHQPHGARDDDARRADK